MRKFKGLNIFRNRKKGRSTQESDTVGLTNLNIKSLSPPEKEIIKNTLELKDKDAREIMVPRVDVCMLPVNAPYDDIIERVSKWGLTRVPVYEENVDDIMGVLYVKDLLHRQKKPGRKRRPPFSLRKILHSPYFLPESKSVLELLRDFREKRVHIGMVVDEYGGFAGIVTLEDVLEEIVGDIQDEYDVDEEGIKENEDGSFTVDARLRIEELNEVMTFTLPTEEAETVGGFLFNYMGRLPKRNEKVNYKGYYFTVVGKSGNIVTKIKIEKKAIADKNENAEQFEEVKKKERKSNAEAKDSKLASALDETTQNDSSSKSASEKDAGEIAQNKNRASRKKNGTDF